MINLKDKDDLTRRARKHVFRAGTTNEVITIIRPDGVEIGDMDEYVEVGKGRSVTYKMSKDGVYRIGYLPLPLAMSKSISGVRPVLGQLGHSLVAGTDAKNSWLLRNTGKRYTQENAEEMLRDARSMANNTFLTHGKQSMFIIVSSVSGDAYSILRPTDQVNPEYILIGALAINAPERLSLDILKGIEFLGALDYINGATLYMPVKHIVHRMSGNRYFFYITEHATLTEEEVIKECEKRCDILFSDTARAAKEFTTEAAEMIRKTLGGQT